MRVFLSYSHRDEHVLERLRTHLAPLRREGHIAAWYDREILAGAELDEEIAEQLGSCQLFLLLVSPDFLASEYCYEREMERALERNAHGEARVIPIIIEPCDWRSSPLSRLRALPRDGRPISEWGNPNSAYLDVVTELRRIVANDDSQIPSLLDPDSLPDVVEVPEPRTTALGGVQSESSSSRQYRIRRDFNEIDRSDFRQVAFENVRDYFQQEISQVDADPSLSGRLTVLSPTSFGCTIVNRRLHDGVAHITVHAGTDVALGDISFSFSENASSNTANGAFVIEADEHELYLKAIMLHIAEPVDKYTPELAAEHLWEEFSQRAGISYD